MDDSEFWRASAPTLRRQLAEGRFSSEELIRATVRRIESLDTATNAFAIVDEEGALHAARAADRARARGDPLGPLHGLPVAVKDVIATRGLRTAYGSRLYADHVPDSEPEVVGRARRAGGIVIGKTTTPEFAHKALTDSPLHGITRNPWSLEHGSGGSSGGAGVAAAMGYCALNMCTDGAGSSRIPAACCGVTGLKPTMGAIPNESASDMFGLQVIGAIGRTVEDVALMFDVMRGPHAADPLTLGAGSRGGSEPGEVPVPGLRIRWLPRIGNTHVDARVLAAATSLLEAFEREGATVLEGGAIDWSLDSWRILLRAQQAQRFGRLPESRRALLDPGMRRCIDEGNALTAAELGAAILERTALYRRVQSLFDGADVIASPVVASPALAATQGADQPVMIDGREAGSLRNAWYCYTIPINASGHPAIALPAGMTEDGLPIGVQFIAPWHAESLLLKIGATVERLRPWADRWPALANAGTAPTQRETALLAR